MKPTGLPSLKRMLLALAAAMVLVSVFAAYLRPGFMLDVANRLWLCF